MATAFILIVSISFIYTLYLQIFSMDQKRAELLSKILLASSVAGGIGLIASFIIFYVRLSAIDNVDLYDTVRNAFDLFAVPIVIWVVISVIITTITHFSGQKISRTIPSFCHLTALLVLLWTLLLAHLAHLYEISLNVYFHISGCALALATLFPAALEIKRLEKNLGDKDYIYSRLHRNDEKHKKAEERKRIIETKNRIKNKTKRR